MYFFQRKYRTKLWTWSSVFSFYRALSSYIAADPIFKLNLWTRLLTQKLTENILKDILMLPYLYLSFQKRKNAKFCIIDNFL